VAEYTNATHTGLVDIESGQWSEDLLLRLRLSKDAPPPIVPTGTAVGKLRDALRILRPFATRNSSCPRVTTRLRLLRESFFA